MSSKFKCSRCGGDIRGLCNCDHEHPIDITIVNKKPMLDNYDGYRDGMYDSLRNITIDHHFISVFRSMRD